MYNDSKLYLFYQYYLSLFSNQMSSLDQVAYPYCRNGNQAKSVCLHQKCDIFPFFCSTCQQHDCQLKHQHSNKITSISFRQFIRHVQQLKRPFPQLVQACNTYSKTLLDFQSKVYAFVLKQLKEIEILKNKPPYLPEKQDEIVKQILNKEYKDLRGKDTDLVWMMKPPKPVEDIGYIQSKTEEVQSLAEDFTKLIALLTENQDDNQTVAGEYQFNGSKSQSPQLIKIQEQNQNLQKILKDRQQQVSHLQESVTALSKENQELILSRDQMMSQYIKNNGKGQTLSFIESAKQSDGEQLKEDIKKIIGEKQDGSRIRPKDSERSATQIPQHKGGRI